MGKPIGERMRRWSWWADQAAHCLAGLVICVLTTYVLTQFCIPTLFSAFFGLVTSIMLGVLREAQQNWGDTPRVGSAEDMLMDLVFWIAGAMLGAIGGAMLL